MGQGQSNYRIYVGQATGETSMGLLKVPAGKKRINSKRESKIIWEGLIHRGLRLRIGLLITVGMNP